MVVKKVQPSGLVANKPVCMRQSGSNQAAAAGVLPSLDKLLHVPCCMGLLC